MGSEDYSDQEFMKVIVKDRESILVSILKFATGFLIVYGNYISNVKTKMTIIIFFMANYWYSSFTCNSERYNLYMNFTSRTSYLSRSSVHTLHHTNESSGNVRRGKSLAKFKNLNYTV